MQPINKVEFLKFKPTPEMITAAEMYLLATAYRQTIEPDIKAIQAAQLSKGRYKWDISNPKRDIESLIKEKGEYISKEFDTYLMNDKDFGHYLTEVHAKYIERGFKVEFDSCPLLKAENVERDTRRLLIDEMQPVTGFAFDDFFRTTDWEENMNKYMDLTMRMLTPFTNTKKILANVQP